MTQQHFALETQEKRAVGLEKVSFQKEKQQQQQKRKPCLPQRLLYWRELPDWNK